MIERHAGDDLLDLVVGDDDAPIEGLDEASLEKLRAATFDVLDEDSSSMLSREELAALTGELPFKGTTALELVMAKDKGLFTSARKLNTQVPDAHDLAIDVPVDGCAVHHPH